ncbi:hypothetical protein, partial [Leptospira interrogans]|uniref:hypothetical protein n=1 Tax=Leptospira interrogans TaxID=173 RepID=UPI001C3FA595
SANTSLNSMYLLWSLCRSVETQQTPPYGSVFRFWDSSKLGTQFFFLIAFGFVDILFCFSYANFSLS